MSDIPSPSLWYYAVNGRKAGPIQWNDLVNLATSGVIAPNDLVWSPSLPGWQPADSIAGLSFPPAPSSPPPLPPGASAPAKVDHSLDWILPVNRSGWAIAAGYLGLGSVLCFLAPFALFTGIMALRDIKKHPHLGGRGRAIFGIVMGGLLTLADAAVLVAAILRKQ